MPTLSQFDDKGVFVGFLIQAWFERVFNTFIAAPMTASLTSAWISLSVSLCEIRGQGGLQLRSPCRIMATAMAASSIEMILEMARSPVALILRTSHSL